MPDPRRVWKADEIVKLKAMAGKEPGERIAESSAGPLRRYKPKPQS